MRIPPHGSRGTAVSLTPVALEHDSRALRVALTLAEAGFRSIVVEARRARIVAGTTKSSCVRRRQPRSIGAMRCYAAAARAG